MFEAADALHVLALRLKFRGLRDLFFLGARGPRIGGAAGRLPGEIGAALHSSRYHHV